MKPVLGINLSQPSFQLHSVDQHGQVVLSKKLSRNKRLLESMVNLAPCMVGWKPMAERIIGRVSSKSWAIRFRSNKPSDKIAKPASGKKFGGRSAHGASQSDPRSALLEYGGGSPGRRPQAKRDYKVLRKV